MDKLHDHTDEMTVKINDPRTIITPHAFSVAPHLLYTPLAAPWKRALAMLIDALVITVLAAEAGIVFAALVLLTSYLGKREGGIGKLAKFGMYLLMSLVLLYAMVEHLRSLPQSASQPNAIKVADAVTFVPQAVRLSLCEDASCANTEALALAHSLADSSLYLEDAQTLLVESLSELPIADKDKQAIEAETKALFSELPLKNTAAAPTPEQAATAFKSKLDAALDKASKSEVEQESGKASTKLMINLDPTTVNNEADPSAAYSPLQWIKGLLNDLGLGFGWAAFYFTVFITWFDGQTLGKKLLGIRVICLDGSTFSLWGAFCRYGGYGAGFATGLIGFLQIFWDANRQAIQDKISSTVVIDLNKPKAVPENALPETAMPVSEESTQ